MEPPQTDAVGQLIAKLAVTPDDAEALVSLARLGPAAQDAVPAVMHAFRERRDPRYRARCCDTLAALLEDGGDDAGREAVELLAAALEDPAFRRMRPKLARSLLKIGFASRFAIPALARTLQKRGRGSMRVPLKRVLIWLAGRCWHARDAADQCYVLAVLEGSSNRYQRWILKLLLEEERGGDAIREEAQRRFETLRAACSEHASE